MKLYKNNMLLKCFKLKQLKFKIKLKSYSIKSNLEKKEKIIPKNCRISVKPNLKGSVKPG